jgi:hypothetical protein
MAETTSPAGKIPGMSYLPDKELDRKVWLDNFNAKLTFHFTTLELTAAEQTSVINDTAMWSFILDFSSQLRASSEEATAYKRILRSGPDGPAGNVPSPPSGGTPPTVVDGDIFERIGRFVQRLKNHDNYTEAIGQDLGIIGPESTFDPQSGMPALELRIVNGNQVQVRWVKGEFQGVRIEVDRDGAGWDFLAIDTSPHYIDTFPGPVPARRRYGSTAPSTSSTTLPSASGAPPPKSPCQARKRRGLAYQLMPNHCGSDAGSKRVNSPAPRFPPSLHPEC